MGLDVAELVMELEDRFGIDLTDEDLEGTYTVADLYRLIVGKLERREGWPCLTSVLFLRIREALMELEGIERRKITPGTDTASLLPPERRRATWDALGKALDLELPPLERPPWLHRFLLASTIAPILAGTCTVLLAPFGKTFAVGAALVAGGIGYRVVASRATRRFATHPPAVCETLGGLGEAVLALNCGKLVAREGRWGRREVWTILRATIEETPLVPATEVRASTPLAVLVDRAQWAITGARDRQTGALPGEPDEAEPGLPDSAWLEFADLLIDLAEKLGVHVSGEELRKVVTVWELYSLLLVKLGHDPANAADCLSSEVFCRLRRAIADDLGVAPRTISPASKTGDVIPLRGRRRQWRALGQASGLALPLLRPRKRPGSRALTLAALLIVEAGLVGVAAAYPAAPKVVSLALLSAIGAAAIGVGAWALAERLGAEIPDGCVTIRGLVRETVRLNQDALTQGRHPAVRARQEVWDTLRDAIAANFRWVEPEEIRGRTPLRELSVRPAAWANSAQ